MKRISELFSGRTPQPPAGDSADPGGEPRDTFDVTCFGRRAGRVYTDQHGLPMNATMAIAVDAKGYLWVGTLGGGLAAAVAGAAVRATPPPEGPGRRTGAGRGTA
jgi:hypothetical protein